MTDLALLKGFALTDTIAWHGDDPIACRQFLVDVMHLVEQLPQRSCVLNLCQDRYHFLVGFAAALVRGQTNLLPPSEAPGLLQEIAARYDEPYCLVDMGPGPSGLDTLRYPENARTFDAPLSIPAIKPEHVAAVAFTSGSTGEPKANRKTWGSLVAGANMARERFISRRRHPSAVVGTVPPQHMYGLESTVLLPIQAGIPLHGARPFFPADVCAVLERLPAPGILVTTPAHIRACVAERTALPELELIISATAPLPHELAQQAEELFHTEVREVFGFTEAGAVASRRTVEGELWRTYDGLSLFVENGRCFVRGSSLGEPVAFNDIVRLRNAYEFSLHGRATDMVNIAGKRASLGDLNLKLNQVEGVCDGVFFLPDEVPGAVTRLMAFVVAPGLSRQDVLNKLRASIDPVFLPRPLYLVDALPRTAAGKLPRARLRDLAAVFGNKTKSA